MLRLANLTLALMLLAGCEAWTRAEPRSNPNAAFAGPTDPIPATTRRLHAGDGVIEPVAPFPGGRRFVVTRPESGDLAIQDRTTGEIRLLTHNERPHFPGSATSPRLSPDGRLIAYVWLPARASGTASRPPELRILEVSGSEPRVIYSEPRQRIIPHGWSADGRTIIAVRSQEDGIKQIVLVPAGGGPVRVVKTLDWRTPVSVAFSPEGRYIAYDFPTSEDSNADRDVYLVDLETGLERRLIEDAANDYLLGWAPDGRHVLFASDRTGTPGAWRIEVAGGRPAGAPVLVKPDLWRALPGSFTSDGAYYYNVLTGTSGTYIATMDPATGAVAGSPIPIAHLSPSLEYAPAWSPDGRFIAALTDRAPARTGGSELVVVVRSLETGRTREFPLPVDLSYPTFKWAPDGRSLVMNAFDRSQYGFFRMDLEGGDVETLFKLEPGTGILSTFGIAGDGRSLVYGRLSPVPSGPRPVDLVSRDFSSGAERVLCRLPYTATRSGHSLAPDGSMLASVQQIGEARSLIVEVVEGCETREPIRLLTDVAANSLWKIIWSPDGRSILFERPASAAVGNDRVRAWRAPLAGGVPQPLELVVPDLDLGEIDREGRRIVFTGGTIKIELWVLENFLPVESSQGPAR